MLTLLILGRAALAAPPPCGDRIQGFNTFEDYDDNMQPETGLTIFDIDEYSPHSSFEGVLVKAEGEAKLEIAFKKTKGAATYRNESFALERSEHKRGYKAAADFEHKKVFRAQDKFFVMRILNEDGKAVCEDAPKEIFPGD